ncbi:cytochrome b/b6 domain-containing protein [Mucilaginibacter sp. X5P1]|uniref:cytochrome b/b6 domain-containing protein n=1 Tax=Mucilaginibacter sp. X5P1 TaxID=2723088 RepID=UPI001614498F|nr:cytochrome b/b6 domain-containing protein [Mucilaginibacter sp. X5P1]MBB6138601.1 Ni,Fe-hydrogenase I cytochrome b subunit [Mucilaginibacter sp. X5P1]
MTTIEPTHKDPEHLTKVKKYSASLRLWHWLNMIIISGSLITVLINSTITDKHAITNLVKTRIQQTKGVDNGLSRSVAGALEDKVWAIHTYFGYCLAGLLLFRLVLEIFQLADQKFIRGLKSAFAQFKATKKDRQEALHEFVVNVIYALFYCLLIIMVVTGLSLAFDDDVPFLRSIHHPVKSVHGFCMYLILAFIIAHIAGVFLAERKKDKKGIVSDMINGG